MKFVHSLSFKIALIVLFMGIVPFSVSVPIYLNAYRTISLRSDGQALISQALRYNNEIVTTGYLEGAVNSKLDDELHALSYGLQGRILIIDKYLRVVKDTYGVDEGKTVIWENVVKAAKGNNNYYFDQDTMYLIVSVPITNSEGEVVGVLLMNKAEDYIVQNQDTINTYFFVAAAVIYLITLFTAIFFSIRFTRPIKNATLAVDNIIREHDTLLPEDKSYNELEELEDKFNQALRKLHDIDNSRQEFVSNVSHELKTPLTSMKVLADSLNSGMDVPLEMYQEFMTDIGNEIDRETQIINDLLALVRMDKSGAALNISAMNMNELIELILKRLKPIADKADVKVIFESFRPVICEVDDVKITLAISNLVENAIKYNNPGGWVHITLNSDHRYCYIKVEDNGLGIPEESVEHVFERFYRADKSHSREIGGTGLGLAITKSAITMHKGDVLVHSVLGEGSTFDVRVPLNYIEEAR
ncbi:MAG: ATP-binding protein [Pseudobutyrivibrio sp.]|nr:ATP-binding protein [Pseudobutyrivibrio sp.]